MQSYDCVIIFGDVSQGGHERTSDGLADVHPVYFWDAVGIAAGGRCLQRGLTRKVRSSVMSDATPLFSPLAVMR